jgi:hypothetical protein
MVLALKQYQGEQVQNYPAAYDDYKRKPHRGSKGTGMKI